METIDDNNRRLFLPSPQEPRSSASASPKKRARFLSPERNTDWDIPDDLPSTGMGEEVNDPSLDNENKGGHGVKPVCLLYIPI